MRRRYFILDVFTGAPLAGNPLAIVRDCDDLDAARMQAIAAEFNLSETVFLLAGSQYAHELYLRDPARAALCRAGPRLAPPC